MSFIHENFKVNHSNSMQEYFFKCIHIICIHITRDPNAASLAQTYFYIIAKG